jgi:hypothetical protein
VRTHEPGDPLHLAEVGERPERATDKRRLVDVLAALRVGQVLHHCIDEHEADAVPVDHSGRERQAVAQVPLAVLVLELHAVEVGTGDRQTRHPHVLAGVLGGDDQRRGRLALEVTFEPPVGQVCDH